MIPLTEKMIPEWVYTGRYVEIPAWLLRIVFGGVVGGWGGGGNPKFYKQQFLDSVYCKLSIIQTGTSFKIFRVFLVSFKMLWQLYVYNCNSHYHSSLVLLLQNLGTAIPMQANCELIVN